MKIRVISARKAVTREVTQYEELNDEEGVRFLERARGKFYRPGVDLRVPIYLEPDVAKVVRQRARKKDASIGAVVNEWLRKDIQSAVATRKHKAR